MWESRYDVSYLKIEDADRGGNWVKIGVAFREEGSTQIVVKLDALPMERYWLDGKLRLFLKE